MKLHGWKTVSGFLFTLAIAAVGGAGTGSELGCSATASGGSSTGSSGGSSGGSSTSSSGVTTITGCNLDATVVCSAGSDGFSCPTGDNPENSDPTASCSTPTNDGMGNDLYCCFTDPGFPANTCTPDDQLTTACPDPTSYGFVCPAADDPSNYDANLNCSSPTPDGANDDFCCTYLDNGGSSSSGSGGGLPAGCTLDNSLGCTTGADGYACAIGDNPETEDPTLSCSTPALAAGEDDYCCYAGFTGSQSTCYADDSLTSACPDPTSYGYVCAANDNPMTYDSSLTCSTPTPDGANDDFCCTFQ